MQTNKSLKLMRIVLAVLTIAIMAFTATACGKKPDENDVSAVVGTYYYDAEGSEYLITLSDEANFEFTVRGENKKGSFTLEGNDITLTVKKKEVYTAKYDNGNVKLSYDGSEMCFLRKEYYTVTFDTANGTAVDAQTVLNGKTAVTPNAPTRGKDLFIGWYSDDALINPYDFSNIISANTTLYAKWAQSEIGQAEYTVSFDLNYEGAEAVANMVTTGGKLYNVTEPKRAGYTFAGWWYSMYNDASKLSYAYASDDVFDENLTLYACWTAETASNKLATPIVDVNADNISWNSVAGASSYRLEIMGPADGFVSIAKTVASTTEAIDFANAPAGDYEIKVTAVSQDSTVMNSDMAVRYYKNKALAKVSVFNVIEPAVLLFNSVANAQKYYIEIDCGDKEHNHDAIDNGSSTNYNFANCAMQDGGITFTVTAVADGYASSVSKQYVYVRALDAISGFNFDAATETLKWDAVAKATGYTVKVTTADGTFTVDNGNKTSFSVKNYASGEMTINVTPVTNGYNSPAPAVYTYNKTTLATPAEVFVDGTVITWPAVENATSYEIKVGGKTLTANTNEYDLANAIQWSRRSNYKLSIRAKGDTDSLWSDEFDVRYQSMSTSLIYGESVVSWAHVIGAEYYEVSVNGGDAITVDGGVNYAEITLTKAGNNDVAVRFYDGEEFSDWATVSVYAYEVSFDARSGKGVSNVYKAMGDKTDLPVSTRDGYDFAGWYNVPEGAAGNGALYNDKNYAYASGARLYAYWKPASYNVTYNYGEYGVVTEEGAKVVFTRNYSLIVPESNDASVIFAGWYSMPDGNGNQYTDYEGNSVEAWNIPSDATMYARWLNVLEFTLITTTDHDFYRVSKGEGATFAKEITIPETYEGIKVEEVAGYAFNNCDKLITINIPDSIVYIDVESSFYSCDYITEINFYETDDPSGLWYAQNGILIKNEQETGLTVVFVPRQITGSVTIMDGVKTIAANVFNGSKISEVVFPASVEDIAYRAFFNCKKLVKISFIPTAEGDQEVGLRIQNEAFAGCTAFDSISIPARVSSVGYDISTEEEYGLASVFSGCSNLAYIEIEGTGGDYTSVDGMIVKGNELVYCPAARSGVITIPVGIETVGENAFANNNRITEVVIPNYVTEVKANAFYNCDNISKVTFESGLQNNEVTIGAYAFASCNSLVDVVYEGKVTEIGAYAFANCVRLTNLYVPASVSLLGEYAFDGCVSAKQITITDDGVDLTVEEAAFSNCSAITEVYLPARVVSFANNAFPGCDKLIGVTVSEDSVHYMTEEGVLYDFNQTEIKYYPKGKIGDFILPESVKTIGYGIFRNNRYLTSITIGINVTTIEDYAFDGCMNLAEVIFAEGGTEAMTIGVNAFSNCGALTEIEFVDRVSAIGQNVFQNDSNLVSVVLPANLKRIENNAFKGLGISAIAIPEGVEYIGTSAFENATKLTSISIPSSVTEIGANAFKNSGLTSVTFADGLRTIGASAFYGVKVTSLNFPKTLALIGKQAFYNATSLTEVTFNDGTEDLVLGEVAKNYYDSQIFYGASALTKVTLSANLTILGYGTFYNCKNLTQLVIPANSRLANIGEQCFYTTNLTSVALPNTMRNIPASGGSFAAIGRNAFQNNVNLTTFSIAAGGEGAFSIANAAFSGCTALEPFTFPATLAHIVEAGYNSELYGIGYNAFDSCSKITSFTIAAGGDGDIVAIDGIIYANDGTMLVRAPMNMSGKVTVPAGVTEISEYAFSGCTNITEVVFEEKEKAVTMRNSTTNSYGTFANSGVTKVTLPAKLTNIGDYAFYKSANLNDLVIPEGVTVIGIYAISGTALTVIDLPASVTTLGNNALRDNASVTELNFASNSSLTTIGSTAFNGLKAITEVILPRSVTTLSGSSNLFGSCSKLKTVVVSDAVSSMNALRGATYDLVFLDSNMYYEEVDDVVFTKTENGAGSVLVYYSRNLEDAEYEIPDGVVEIGAYAFQYNGYIEKVTIPATVTWIRSCAFYGCEMLYDVVFEDGEADLRMENQIFACCYSLTSFTFPARLVDPGLTLFEETPLSEIYFEEGSRMEAITCEMFANMDGGFEEITIPASVKVIEDNSLASSVLKRVYFEEGSQLEEIYNDALCGSRNLEYFEFPESLKYIGETAFSGCTSLKEVILGDNVTTVDYTAFNKCTSLEKVRLSAKMKTIYEDSFANCTALKELIIPDGVKTIEANAFSNCNSLEKLVLGNSVEYIGENAFSGASELVALEIPESVTYIGEYAFTDATSLAELIFVYGFNDLEMGEGAFYNCKALENCLIPERLSGRIGDYAFYGAENLAEITIPGTVDVIGAYAFAGASNVQTITIEAGVVEIDDFAFMDCSSVTRIYIPETVQTIGSNPFMGCVNTELDISELNKDIAIDENGLLYNGLMTQLIWVPATFEGVLTLPETVTDLAGGAFAGCKYLTGVVFHGAITEIKANTFNGTAINSITIGANVTYIGDYAFANCKNLTEVIFAKGGINKLRIGVGAFQNCTALESIEIPYRVRNNLPEVNDGTDGAGIGDRAFEGCINLSSVTFEATGSQSDQILENMLGIGNYAFYGCESLTEFIFPDYLGVQSNDNVARYIKGIGDYAFANTSLSNVDFQKRAEYGIVGPNGSISTTPSVGGTNDFAGLIIGAYAFAYIDELTSINLPTDVRHIQEGAFAETGLVQVVIPKNVQYLYSKIFMNCKNLTKVTYAGNVNAVYDSAYEGCTALSEIVWNASSVGYIAPYAFKGCTALTSLTISNSSAKIGVNAFDGWTASQTINFTANSVPGLNFVEGWNNNCEAVINWENN